MSFDQTPINQLITDNIDTWTSTVKTKATTGRGSSKKLELYGVKKLRELILELAVRGKLVPQDPSDEPASVLLERIAAEKAQLVKDKRIKKPKKLSEIKEEDELFTLPKGWAWARLGTVGNVFNGNSISTRLKSEKYSDGVGLPYLSTKDIGYGFDKLSYTVDTHVPENEPKFKLAPKSTVLICAEGGSAGKKCGLVDRDIFFGNKLFANVPYSGIKSSFLLSLYLTPLFFEQFSEKMTGIIGGISVSNFVELLVPVPPQEEQHRIVAKVDELMTLCDQLEQQTEASIAAHQVLVTTLLDTLTNSANAEELMQNWQMAAEHFDTLFTTEESIDQLKQTILQLAVMGKLVPQDPNDEPAAKLLERIAEEKAQLIKEKKIKKQKALPPISDDEMPFELPSGWEFAHMQDLCSLITDGTHQTPKYTDDGRPFISAQCVKPFKFMPQHCRYVSEEHYQAYIKNRKPEFEDILLSRVGAGIGEAAVIDSDIEFAIYVSTGLLKPHKSQIHARYLELWLNSPIGRGFSERNTLGKGVSQGNLNLTLIRSFIVSLPPIKEQLRIVAKFRELNEMCDQLIERLRDSQQTQLQLTDAIVEQAL
ncbi:restriction endonuclease subunit S [Vibrio ouci]|uniref:Restriction endonuclease subunit S n=1 Tax=Vibrio ouci TaxID=2499078 RepID=A0A4Y8WLA1_9VIBR|nr:restriction endonuclease subunit S [Vibrio ouci]TFH93697.1 restriction endonuclease subunit S [Vibrio ouci]